MIAVSTSLTAAVLLILQSLQMDAGIGSLLGYGRFLPETFQFLSPNTHYATLQILSHDSDVK
jgi:hypothetical protein